MEENKVFESIKHIDEEENEYVISFEESIPDVVVSRFKDLSELEKECAERKQQ